MKRDRLLLFFLIFWLLYNGIITQWFWKQQFLTFVPDVLIFFIGFRIGFRQRNRIKIDKSLMHKVEKELFAIILILFFLVGIFSAVLASESILSWLWGSRVFLRYIILFWEVYYLMRKKDIARIKKILYVALWSNFAFIFFESLILKKIGDGVGGTFSGGNSDFLNFLLPVSFLLLGDYFQKRGKITALLLYTSSVLFFAIVGEVKIVYVLLPIVVYGMYVLIQKFSIKHIVSAIIAFTLLIPTYQFFMRFWYDDGYVDHIFSTDFFVEETSNNGFGTFNRSTVLITAPLYLTTDTKTKLVGHGFGAASTSALFVSKFGQQHGHLAYQLFTTSYLLAEVGWIGLILFFLFHVILLFRFYSLYYKYRKDSQIKYWSAVGIMSCMVQFIMMWYNNKPVLHALLWVILWAMIFLAIKYRLKERENAPTITTKVIIGNDKILCP